MNQSQYSQAGMSKHPNVFDALTLSFINTETEQAFRADYVTSSIKQIRLSLFFGFFLYATFGLLDRWIVPDIKEAAWVIRYAIICPLILACIAYSYSRNFPNHFEMIVTILSAVGSFGVIIMVAIAKPPGSYLYYAGLLLCSVFYFSFLRLRFVTATFLAWAVFCVYEIVALKYTGIPAAYFINNTVVFFTFNISGMLICYSMEKHRRADFLHRTKFEEQTEHLNRTVEKLEEQMKQNRELCRDPLTALFSRTYFLSLVELECNRYSRFGKPFSVLLLDIDGLQLIKDSFGDVVAESVVLAVARRTVIHLRPYDVACRYHNCCLAILLPETRSADAELLATRLRQDMEKTPIPTEKGPLSLLASTGVAAVCSKADGSVETIIDAAFRALHKETLCKVPVSSLLISAPDLSSAS